MLINKDRKPSVYLRHDALQTNCDSRFVPFTGTNPHLTDNYITSSLLNSGTDADRTAQSRQKSGRRWAKDS